MTATGWETDIDDALAAVEASAQMKRIHPLLFVAVAAALLIVGVVWKVSTADKCVDRGGTVVAPMKRFQHCAE